ncbi:helix-turn-helix domain-containing protein [Streptomyces achromogenes]|uniref:helix-turn-helix domain-containing protein n=1 Tax=Streptomyces achromogenes TaxID=67255 RepID=UPI0036F57E56
MVSLGRRGGGRGGYCAAPSTWCFDARSELLRDPDLSVANIAQEVGYSGPFALSAAFKRERGVSPQEFRRGKRSEETLTTGSDGRTVVLRT